ncbi:MAG: hypothetical protein EBS90_13150, partial [Betaproteobacteria bacterium]|nr:hypothetical protein [Betaproteobacteria bacterium]
MGAPSKGSVVLVPFPFSDLSQAKYRPAVVLAASGKGDWVLCQVTSKSYGDEKAIRIGTHDFESGGLRLNPLPVVLNFLQYFHSERGEYSTDKQ